jgi:seryl-tRNA synthetase
VASYRPATAEQAQLHDDLVAAGHLVPTDAAGIYGQGPDFVRVRTGFTDAVSGLAAADAGVEAMAYPPLLPRYQIEKNGYLGSFPHLAGSVFSFDGNDGAAAEQEARAAKHEDWSEFQSMTDLVVLPAACYPVYPEIAKRGPLPAAGVIVDTGDQWVFRNEPSGDPARMRQFHMREFVRVASPEDIAAFRNLWLDRTVGLFGRLGLDATSEIAADPFFGRVGRMLAANQRDQELKFELVAMIGGPEPTAIASFNYHQDHFTLIYDLGFEGGAVAHTGCVAFGIERITLALFRAHGMDVRSWPREVGAELFR